MLQSNGDYWGDWGGRRVVTGAASEALEGLWWGPTGGAIEEGEYKRGGIRGVA